MSKEGDVRLAQAEVTPQTRGQKDVENPHEEYRVRKKKQYLRQSRRDVSSKLEFRAHPWENVKQKQKKPKNNKTTKKPLEAASCEHFH